MSPKEKFIQDAYGKLTAALKSIPEETEGTVYAISFWYQLDNDDPRYPKITVSYNTLEQVSSEAEGASSEGEAKWNFAYWLQEETGEIGGEEDDALAAWYDFLNDEGNGEDSGLGPAFVEVIIGLAQRFHSEGTITKLFGKDLPIIVHELEYYDEPVDWTMRANPAGLVEDFVAAYRAGEL